MEDTNTLIAWDKDIIEKKDIIYIGCKVVTSFLNNINVKAKVITLFFDKNTKTL